MRQLPQINECFAAGSVEEIRQALESRPSDWSRSTLAAMEKCASALCETLLGSRV